MRTVIKRIKRTIQFYKLLSYGAWSWWLPIPSTDKDYAGEHAILCDKETYGKKGLQFKIAKIKAAWLYAQNHLLNNDGLYCILSEDKNNLMLYKVSI